MSTKDLESVRECCTNLKSFLIIYEGGDTADLPVLICDYCLENKPFFQKSIKSKEPAPKTSELILKRNVQK